MCIRDRTRAASIITTSDSSTHPTKLIIGTFTTIPIIFGTGNVERMRIEGNGNVGIGDTSPSFPLVVSKSSSSTGNGSDVSMRMSLVNPDQTNNNYALMAFGDGTSQPGSGFFGMQFTDHTNNYGDLCFGTRGASGYGEKMRILSDGNVGIGDTTPDYRLSVAKVSAAAPAIMVSGAFFGGPRIQTYGLDADPNAWMGLGTDMSGGAYEHNLYFSDHSSLGRLSIGTYNGTTYSEKMCVLRTGNVGIGIADPGARLSLGDASGQQFYVYEGGDVRAGFGVDLSGSSRELSMFCTSSNGFSNGNISFGYRLESNGAYQERMRMTSGGNFGIGTTTPGFKLDVAGTLGVSDLPANATSTSVLLKMKL